MLMRPAAFFGSVVLMALCFAPLVRADIPVAAQPTEPKIGVQATAYPMLRIGDLAPRWAFKGADGKVWSSQEFIGQRSQVLLTDNGYPLFGAAGAASPIIIAEAKSLYKRGAILIYVPRERGSATLDESTNILIPHFDVNDKLNKILGVGTLTFVDRAGFLRSLQPARFKAWELLQRLREIDQPLPPVEIGQPAPDFSMLDMNGQVRRPSDLRGRKNLLLVFFPKTFCSDCATELSSLRDKYFAFSGNDTEIWAVSVDATEGEAGQRAFADKLGLPFPLISDAGRNLSFLYGTVQKPTDRATRMSVLIDKNGIVRAIDRTVNPAEHGQDMLNRMAALGMLKPETQSMPLGPIRGGGGKPRNHFEIGPTF